MSPTVFELTLRFPDADIDPQGHVNNVAFVRYVQDAAVAHWRAFAPAEVRSAVTWVVRRHEVEYLRDQVYLNPRAMGHEVAISYPAS